MSLGIINCVGSRPDPINNRFALAFDGVAFVSLSVICALALANIGSLGQVKTQLCISGCVIGVGIIVSDILGYYKFKRNLKVSCNEQFAILRQNLRDSRKDQLSSMVKNARAMDDDHRYFQDLPIPCHRLFGALWIGNFGGLIQTTEIAGITVLYGSEIQKVELLGNPHQFKSIITLNDVSQSILYHCFPKNFNHAQLETYFREKGISWINLPISEENDPRSALLTKCKTLYGEEGIEHIFREIDKAVFEGHETLIHCHSGQIHSALLLTAYMINRFGVTAEEAFTYLKSVRGCVKPL